MSALAFACVVIVWTGFLASSQVVPYALSTWPCGVIVWPNEVPDYADDFAQRLTEAAETAFGFWGYELPFTTDEPHDEASAVRIYNPATQTELVVPGLTWNDREIPPVVVFAFPGELTMRAVMGNTDLYGAFWCPRPLDRDLFPDAKSWIWDVGTGYCNIVCASSADDEILIHECAHWFTYQWCYPRRIVPHHLPDYIMEGIAELTCAVVEDPNDKVYDRLSAYSWAKHSCLSGSIQGVMRYAVGESLVSYLVDTLGLDDFLGTLRNWTTRTWLMIDLYEAEWRVSLDLPSDCPNDTE